MREPRAELLVAFSFRFRPAPMAAPSAQFRKPGRYRLMTPWRRLMQAFDIRNSENNVRMRKSRLRRCVDLQQIASACAYAVHDLRAD
jgi:hypothetical protein